MVPGDGRYSPSGLFSMRWRIIHEGLGDSPSPFVFLGRARRTRCRVQTSRTQPRNQRCARSPSNRGCQSRDTVHSGVETERAKLTISIRKMPVSERAQSMEAKFWHDRWASNEIGFHKSEANPLLVKYLDELSLAKGSRIFLPLCGKTLDIGWLLSCGYQVAGAELSAVAMKQLFAELGVMPTITKVGALDHYRARQLDIFVGDIFKVTPELLGLVDAIYDRAALVALPEAMRVRYAEHLMTLTGQAPQLLISFEYDQQAMEGPPFSVSEAEVRQHYGERYDITLLTSLDVPGGLKGRCPATERVYVLAKGRR